MFEPALHVSGGFGVIDMALLSVIRRWHFREHLSIREIGRRTGLSRNTIRKYLRSEGVEPEFKVPERPSKLDPLTGSRTVTCVTPAALHAKSISKFLSGTRSVHSFTRHNFCSIRADLSMGPLRMLWEQKGPNWSTKNWSLRGGFRRITLNQTILHHAFGHPLPNHADWKPQMPLTQEEWQAAALQYGHDCDEYERNPMLPPPYGKPRSQT